MFNHQLVNDELELNEVCKLYQQTKDDRLFATMFVRVYLLAVKIYISKFCHTIPEEDFCDMFLCGLLANAEHYNPDNSVKFATYFTTSLINRCVNFLKPKKVSFNNNAVIPCGTLITEPDEDAHMLHYIDKLIYNCCSANDMLEDIEFNFVIDSLGLTEIEIKVVNALIDGYNFKEITKMFSIKGNSLQAIRKSLQEKFMYVGLFDVQYSV